MKKDVKIIDHWIVLLPPVTFLVSLVLSIKDGNFPAVSGFLCALCAWGAFMAADYYKRAIYKDSEEFFKDWCEYKEVQDALTIEQNKLIDNLREQIKAQDELIEIYKSLTNNLENKAKKDEQGEAK